LSGDSQRKRLTYPADGQRIASASADGTIKIWDASLSQPK
jgi:WD40 repeat protein